MKIFATRILLLACIFSLNAAKTRQKPISVPFDIVGSYVVVSIQINHSTPLNLILDSGVRNTIITELTTQDSLSINYANTTTLKGLGNGSELTAYTSDNNSIQLKNLELVNQTVLVLEKDIFNLSKYTGQRINGLLGSDIFQNHIVEINYSRKRLLFYDTASFIVPPKYEKQFLSIEGQKMYIQLPITEINGKTREVKMLVDTGAELAAWFLSYSKKAIAVPEKRVRGFIGQGLNGEISGFVGRISAIGLGGKELKNPIVTFPDSVSINEATAESDRDGTLGSQILNRFNLIVDTHNNLLYLKPNSNFKKRFTYNIAGLEMVQQTFFLRMPEVIVVWKNSPAELAGIKVGDQLLEVNGRKSYQYDINEIRRIFETPAHSLRLLLLRDEKQISVKLNMRSVL